MSGGVYNYISFIVKKKVFSVLHVLVFCKEYAKTAAITNANTIPITMMTVDVFTGSFLDILDAGA